MIRHIFRGNGITRQQQPQLYGKREIDQAMGYVTYLAQVDMRQRSIHSLG